MSRDDQTAHLLQVDRSEPILYVEDFMRDTEGRPRAINQIRFRGFRTSMYSKSYRRL